MPRRLMHFRGPLFTICWCNLKIIQMMGSKPIYILYYMFRFRSCTFHLPILKFSAGILSLVKNKKTDIG